MSDSMKKAVQKISILKGQSFAYELSEQFECIQQMPGGNRIFNKILSADQDQLEDYLAEIRYALIFSGLGFQIQVYPLGRKGPDLKISRNGNHAVVEITRFRKEFPGPPELVLDVVDPILPIYGNPKRDVKKSLDKIHSKYKQITNENAIIAIWNDDGDLDEIEVRIAVNDIIRDACEGKIPVPSNLSFVLYGCNWINLSNKQQLYCFPLGNQESYIIGWQNELKRSIVSGLIQRALALSSVSLTR
ncbi:MAG: hypothetical protein Q8N13_12750 [Acidovorax sp.]|nr:hypothetical protein [Acidovorax sp.]